MLVIQPVDLADSGVIWIKLAPGLFWLWPPDYFSRCLGHLRAEETENCSTVDLDEPDSSGLADLAIPSWQIVSIHGSHPAAGRDADRSGRGLHRRPSSFPGAGRLWLQIVTSAYMPSFHILDPQYRLAPSSISISERHGSSRTFVPRLVTRQYQLCNPFRLIEDYRFPFQRLGGVFSWLNSACTGFSDALRPEQAATELPATVICGGLRRTRAAQTAFIFSIPETTRME